MDIRDDTYEIMVMGYRERQNWVEEKSKINWKIKREFVPVRAETVPKAVHKRVIPQ